MPSVAETDNCKGAGWEKVASFSQGAVSARTPLVMQIADAVVPPIGPGDTVWLCTDDHCCDSVVMLLMDGNAIACGWGGGFQSLPGGTECFRVGLSARRVRGRSAGGLKHTWIPTGSVVITCSTWPPVFASPATGFASRIPLV